VTNQPTQRAELIQDVLTAEDRAEADALDLLGMTGTARADSPPEGFQFNTDDVLVLEHVSSFIVGGKVSRSIFPCRNCGELFDHAHDTCSCWTHMPPMTENEHDEKMWQIVQWCSTQNARKIESGAPCVDIDVIAYMPVIDEARREALTNAHTFRASHP